RRSGDDEYLRYLEGEVAWLRGGGPQQPGATGGSLLARRRAEAALADQLGPDGRKQLVAGEAKVLHVAALKGGTAYDALHDRAKQGWLGKDGAPEDFDKYSVVLL